MKREETPPLLFRWHYYTAAVYTMQTIFSWLQERVPARKDTRIRHCATEIDKISLQTRPPLYQVEARLTSGSFSSPSFNSSTNSLTSTASSPPLTACCIDSSSFGEVGIGVDEVVPAVVCVREGISGVVFDEDAGIDIID